MLSCPGRPCSYAYGLLLWCLFSGRRNAWVGPTGALPTDQGLMGVLSGVLRGERPPLSALREGTPQAIVALITRCWAHDPADRPSALEVAVETQAWLAVSLHPHVFVAFTFRYTASSAGHSTSAKAALVSPFTSESHRPSRRDALASQHSRRRLVAIR